MINVLNADLYISATGHSALEFSYLKVVPWVACHVEIFAAAKNSFFKVNIKTDMFSFVLSCVLNVVIARETEKVLLTNSILGEPGTTVKRKSRKKRVDLSSDATTNKAKRMRTAKPKGLDLLIYCSTVNKEIFLL